MKYCNKCGEELKEDTKFCHNCGNKIVKGIKEEKKNKTHKCNFCHKMESSGGKIGESFICDTCLYDLKEALEVS
tara:strand:+ start:66557 stop:66778 length:222 start_codon:yes stop_codon:yes gene_type:complete